MGKKKGKVGEKTLKAPPLHHPPMGRHIDLLDKKPTDDKSHKISLATDQESHYDLKACLRS